MNKSPVTSAYAELSANRSCSKTHLVHLAPRARPPTAVHIARKFRSDHPGGCHFLFADGSVHFLTETIDMLTYQNLSTVQGGEM